MRFLRWITVNFQFSIHRMLHGMDKLSFDLINFDLAHRVFPENACSFIVHMTGVAIPTDTISQDW